MLGYGKSHSFYEEIGNIVYSRSERCFEVKASMHHLFFRDFRESESFRAKLILYAP